MKNLGVVQLARRQAAAFLQGVPITNQYASTVALLLAKENEFKTWRTRLARHALVNVNEADTLHDIFMNLVLIQQDLPDQLDGRLVALAVQKLVQNEIKPGGPYGTKKPDLTTNLLIAKFLSGMDALPDNLKEYCTKNAKAGAADNLVAALSLDIQGVSSHTKFSKVEPESLASLQHQDGSWGQDKDRVLDTALAYLRLSEAVHTEQTSKALRQEIYDYAKCEIDLLPRDLQEVGVQVFNAVEQADQRSEIVFITKHFAENWSQPESRLSHAKTLRYGVANIFLWMAYTIYDDFIDEEGVPNLLPPANCMHRRVLSVYAKLAGNHTLYQTTVLKAFDTMDAANEWELTHCRFKIAKGNIMVAEIPDYGGG